MKEISDLITYVIILFFYVQANFLIALVVVVCEVLLVAGCYHQLSATWPMLWNRSE